MLVVWSASAATLTVTNTNDAGLGSLRQAILDANAAPGSTITFAIASGPQRIRPLSFFPKLDSGVIDGSTQPGYAGAPLIELDGSLLPANGAFFGGLTIGEGALARAVVVNRCPTYGILLYGPGRVVGSYVGTDATGTLGRPNSAGIKVILSGAIVGGTNPGEGNVVSGNSYGIVVSGPATILGNLIGTDFTGTSPLPNAADGIFVDSPGSSITTIGGATPGSRNVISGNSQYGIEVFYANDVLIQGNVIGPDVSGRTGLGAQRAGVDTYQSTRVTIGGSPAAANVIAFHTFVGVAIETGSTRILVSQNSIWANAFGIDLDFDLNNSNRITPNDPGDPDVGPNLLQNFPILTSAVSIANGTSLAGGLNSEPNSTFTIELFANTACNSSGNGEGQTFLGSLSVTTDSVGNASFSSTFPQTLHPGDVITATATDAFGDTSEFSACFPATVISGPLGFYTLPPCRIVDTRDPDGPQGGPALAANATRQFDLAWHCGVPASAAVVSTNVVAVAPTASGFLRFFAADAPSPTTSSITFRLGQTRANNALVSVSAGGTGSIKVQNGSAGSVDFVLDVNGYFQ
jgi:hypothetical protein